MNGLTIDADGVDVLLATTALNGLAKGAPNVLLPPNKEVAGPVVVVELEFESAPKDGVGAEEANADPPNKEAAGAVVAGAATVEFDGGPNTDVVGLSLLAVEKPENRFVDVELFKALKRPNF